MRKNIALLFSIIVCAFFAPAVCRGDGVYSFRVIDGNIGLSSNNVKSIMQDSYGFVWIGTNNGLNRYDGRQLRLLNCFDYQKHHGNNNIDALYEDKRKNLWVGTDRGVFIYNQITDRFTFLDTKDARHGKYAENWVQDIIGDSKGGVWALLPDEGVFRYLPNGKTEFYKVTPDNKFKEVYPSSICSDHYGNIWVATTGDGLYRFNWHTSQFVPVRNAGSTSMIGLPFWTMSEDATGALIISTINGRLYRYSPQENSFSTIQHAYTGKLYVNCMACLDDEILLGTRDGLVIVSLSNGGTRVIRENPVDRYSLSSNAIYALSETQGGDILIGTFYGGADILLRNKFCFEKYGIASGLSSQWVRGLAQDGNGNVWIGTENNGLNIFNPLTKAILAVPGSPKTVLALTNIDGDIYAGAQGVGMDVFSPSGAMKPFSTDIKNAENGIYAYLIDSRGNEWLGLGYSLFRSKPGAKNFEHVSATGFDWIFTIKETHDGTVWFGTMGNGLWKYTPANGQFKRYIYSEDAPTGLRSNSISSLFEDSQGNLWVSTDRGGISRYNSKQDNFTTYGTPEGLPDDVAYNILEDDNGNLWFGTNKGLVKFNPKTHYNKVFTVEDGLPSNQFNYASAIKGNDGLFYFGTIGGLIVFDPKAENAQTVKQDIYFTKFRIVGKEVTPLSKESPLKDNIMFTDKIELPYDVGAFSLDVASPHIEALGSVRYSYKLDDDNDQWIDIPEQHISFSNLPPGKYNLVVKADNFGKSSQRRLTIIIHSPWWSSWWALIIYCVLIGLAAWRCFVYYRNRKLKEIQNKQRLFAVNKEKELYQNKVSFFTEVAHEIRTPLTLIEAPLEAIEETGVKDSKVKQYLHVMRQNTKRLLHLTGQLLDFQKLSSNRLVLKPTNVDIAALVKETVDRFKPTMTLKGKTLTCDIPDEELITSTDEEAVTKIISNLLNNAMKYGKRAIDIKVTHDHSQVVISVYSDGAPIEGDERKRIFEPFYQVDKSESGENGVGIGLPLSSSLAKLLGGSLTLADDKGNGNTFVLVLPIDKKEVKANNAKATERFDFVIEDESNQSKEGTGACTVLIVEDNDNMRNFLADQVKQWFTVLTAANGKEAMKILKSTGVDMVVTDVMMPEMNGFELCKAVKSDLDLSHIPVIFITAKNDMESKVKGLEIGAEAYIEKPFSIKYFRQLIRSIMDNRRREREFFSKKPFYDVDNMHVNKADEEFMNKVVKAIKDNLEDETFNVESMADIFCMSHSSLLRKIKTVFNLSPVELIRTVRLKRAAELINEGKYRISDICYMVGITSPSYFSKLFFKQFGVTPKDFERQCQNKSRKTGKESPEDSTLK